MRGALLIAAFALALPACNSCQKLAWDEKKTVEAPGPRGSTATLTTTAYVDESRSTSHSLSFGVDYFKVATRLHVGASSTMVEEDFGYHSPQPSGRLIRNRTFVLKSNADDRAVLFSHDKGKTWAFVYVEPDPVLFIRRFALPNADVSGNSRQDFAEIVKAELGAPSKAVLSGLLCDPCSEEHFEDDVFWHALDVAELFKDASLAPWILPYLAGRYQRSKAARTFLEHSLATNLAFASSVDSSLADANRKIAVFAADLLANSKPLQSFATAIAHLEKLPLEAADSGVIRGISRGFSLVSRRPIPMSQSPMSSV